ncbi:MAG: hypothetical protein GQ565_10510 [Candidatus Aegiribacteria sp.]|nr:hypothetical protein [Candidatus Aegiribacteria sp.]
MKLSGIIFIAAVIISSACLTNSNSDNPSCETIVVLDTLESPGENITGLAWGDGDLWAVDAESDMIFRINTITGEIIDSFKYSAPSSFSATGLAFSEEHNRILLGLWNHSNNGYIYSYSTRGEYIGSISMCGG